MRVVVATLFLASAVTAQLTDLQPGRNFPTATAAFGLNRSEELDAGDVDNDGDMDVVVANGGDFGNEVDRLFINQGGAQGGTIGSYVEAPLQFPSVSDTSRDVELVDIDADADLDIYIVNNTNGNSPGGVSRFYVNQGGAQLGSVGAFLEDTDARWGALLSVPEADQVFGGNHGPWRDWASDGEFADLDDDGDLDLFHVTVGPVLNGTRPTRVFLNDGTGVFNELFPWADAGADIHTHSFDADLCDLEGDYDIDVVMASRDTASRVYQNNLHGALSGATTLFTDTTQQAFVDQGILDGSGNYELEAGDLDGDDDFDIWSADHGSMFERALSNEGPDASGYVRFMPQTTWIKGVVQETEQAVEFGDYDGDGDLDVLLPNFSGTSRIFQSGVAQGLNSVTQGLFHRTGPGPAGSLASSFPETPFSDSNTTLDGEWFDADNDGDDDYAKGNDGNQQNDLVLNRLGIPDTHAPTFFRAEEAEDQVNGVEVVVHAQIRDNHSDSLMVFFDAAIMWCVDGVEQPPIAMRAQGSMQYRGAIPAQTDATVRYHFEVTDLTGNTGVSDEFVYVQGAGFDPWTDLGGGIAGVSGIPTLAGTGSLIAGEPASLDLTGAAPGEDAALFVALSPVSGAPFKGGTLIAFPFVLLVPLATDGSGEISLPFVALELPCSTELVLQVGVSDAVAVQDVALSNGLLGVVP